MDTDIDEALIELYGYRDEVLQRSVKALLGLDLSRDDEERYYTDFLILHDMVSELWKEDVKVQACFVAEANRFLRDGNNDTREACLERAYKRMSDMRMSYLDSEWRIAAEVLEGKDGVYMRGKVDGECDPDALWVDLSDGNGATYAYIYVTMESNDPTNDTYASSLTLGARFVVLEFEVVDSTRGFIVNPIDGSMTLATRAESSCTKLDTGVLCDAIVSEVKQLIESHNRKCAAKRMYEQFR